MAALAMTPVPSACRITKSGASDAYTRAAADMTALWCVDMPCNIRTHRWRRRAGHAS